MSNTSLYKNTNLIINSLRTALNRINNTEDDYPEQEHLDSARVHIRTAIHHLNQARATLAKEGKK